MLSITVDTDNAAFAALGPEIARLLRECADDAETYLSETTIRHSRLLHDHNGNRVGEMVVTQW